MDLSHLSLRSASVFGGRLKLTVGLLSSGGEVGGGPCCVSLVCLLSACVC